MKKMPTLDIIRSRYSYDPETGVVTQKLTSKAVSGRCKRGYGRVRIDKQYYQLHRVIWVLMTGDDPGDKLIDHINRDPTDNRWNNLRLVTVSQNQQNTTGWNIYRDKREGRSKPWRATIRHEGKLQVIGTYACPLIARLAFEDKAKDIRGDYSPV